MKLFNNVKLFLAGGALSALAFLSACATKPPPPPPPAPVAVVIPPKPYPPLGAPATLTTPPRDGNGVRLTPNVDISPAQVTWNLRSAYNVAALNCVHPEHAAILENYRAFLKANAKTLTATYKEVEKEFRDKDGKSYIAAREAYATRVYNYFALPPTLPAFCDAALAMSEQAKTVAPGELATFAAASLPRLDSVFVQFFDSYDQYRSDLGAWEARYGGARNVAPPAITYQNVTQTAAP